MVDGMVYLIDSLENREADYVGYEDETTENSFRKRRRRLIYGGI